MHFPQHIDPNPLVLTEEEKNLLEDYDDQISEIEKKKIIALRAFAKEKGLRADNLADLKSNCGEPFVEYVEEDGGLLLSRRFRRAVAKNEKHFSEEFAYLCRGLYEKEGADSCGWVKGIPKEGEFNEIVFLAGTAGIRHFCKICGKKISELVLRQS